MKTRALITKTAETGTVNNNYRVPMPLNGRQVTFYHDDSAHAGTAAAGNAAAGNAAAGVTHVTFHDDNSASAAAGNTAIIFASCAALVLN